MKGLFTKTLVFPKTSIQSLVFLSLCSLAIFGVIPRKRAALLFLPSQ